MNPEPLRTTLSDLSLAISGICMGSVEWTVLHDAGMALIRNWNDHNEKEYHIDEAMEIERWEAIMANYR